MLHCAVESAVALLAVCALFYSSCPAFTLLLAAAVLVAIRLLRVPQIDSSKVEEIMRGVTIVGHRGCTDLAPENSIAAIRSAKARGAQAVEFDVAFTKDGTAILMHDSTLDRTTFLSGTVEDFTYDELKETRLRPAAGDAAGRHVDERVPTLEEAIAECRRLDLKMFLDLKGSQSERMAATLECLQQRSSSGGRGDLHLHAIVCSFYPQTIYAIRRRSPEFVTALTHRTAVLTLASPDGPVRNRELWKRLLAPAADALLEAAIYGLLWYVCGTSLFLINEREVSARQKAYWRARGVSLVVWTVNDDAQKRYLTSVLGLPYMTDRCP